MHEGEPVPWLLPLGCPPGTNLRMHCGPLTSCREGPTVTMWDNGDSFFPAALGNCCVSHRGIGTKPPPHPCYPDSWGWRLRCLAPLPRDLWDFRVTGKISPFDKGFICGGRDFPHQKQGREGCGCPLACSRGHSSCQAATALLCRALEVAKGPLQLRQLPLLLWESDKAEGCLVYTASPCAFGWPEPFPQVRRNFWLVFPSLSEDAKLVVQLTAGILQPGSGFTWHISHCIHPGAASLLCQGFWPTWSHGTARVLQLKPKLASCAQPCGT